MIILSTGQDSTLKNWISLSTLAFGKESEATKFLEEKARTASHGVDEEVISDEKQLIQVLGHLHFEGPKND